VASSIVTRCVRRGRRRRRRRAGSAWNAVAEPVDRGEPERHVPERVEERQDAEQAVVVRHAHRLRDASRFAIHVELREHDALRLAGAARREDDRGDVVGRAARPRRTALSSIAAGANHAIAAATARETGRPTSRRPRSKIVSTPSAPDLRLLEERAARHDRSQPRLPRGRLMPAARRVVEVHDARPRERRREVDERPGARTAAAGFRRDPVPPTCGAVRARSPPRPRRTSTARAAA
jgi:hypothetical protein